MKTASIADIADIREFASTCAQAGCEYRFIEEMKAGTIETGQWVRQGDLYVIAIRDLDGWAETTNRQLVAGTTRGARHMVDEGVRVMVGPDNGKAMKLDDKVLCIGPQLESSKRFEIAHGQRQADDHATFSLPPGRYQCLYQYDVRTKQRVED